MCSDGLSNMVDEDECLAVLQSDTSLEDKVDELVERALTAGGDDNVTVVLIENRPAEASGKEG
ncbi:Serine/threonine phosphatase stp [compost metagenome]